jgi:hypothetical protein
MNSFRMAEVILDKPDLCARCCRGLVPTMKVVQLAERDGSEPFLLCLDCLQAIPLLKLLYDAGKTECQKAYLELTN